MMSSPSSEEVNAQRSDFGLRLSNSMAKYGPLCVGIDPHRKNLTDWGYNVDAEGAELFSMRMLQAMRDRAAAVKFQEPMFERYGSKGFAALERVLYAARQMGIITIVDCLHGGLSTTISAIADAYLQARAPLCWPTPSPCCHTMAHAHCGASPMRPSTTVAASSSPP